MQCSFCGYFFEENKGRLGCKGCVMASYCGKMKCPRCGYEILPEPGLVKLLRKWRHKDDYRTC